MDRLRVVWEEAEPAETDGRREYVWELDTLLEGGVFKNPPPLNKKRKRELSTYRFVSSKLELRILCAGKSDLCRRS